MEQLINTLLANTQMPQAAPAAQKSGSAQPDSFQKLLEQKAQTNAKPEKADQKEAAQSAQNTQDAEQPQEAQEVQQPQQPAAPRNGRELEDQMALAAMAMLQNPVVPVEQAEAAPEVQAEVSVDAVSLDVAAPLAVETVLEPERQSTAPEEEAIAPIPVEEAEAPAAERVQAKEELPQTIEAPEAPQKTEAPAVEARAEVRTEARAKETEAAPQAVEESDTEETPELQDAEVEAPVFEDVKAVPVKVGEAPRTEETAETEDIGEQIGAKMIVTSSVTGEGGDQKITVDLVPENLGRVQVEVTVSKDGTLHVTLNAENSRTQSLLNRNSDSLAAILGRYAEKEVRVEVPRQEESQRQDLYEQQQEQHRQRRQQEQRRKQAASGEDFLQQLRLGLIPLDGE